MENLAVRPPVASQFAADYDALFFVMLALTIFFTVLVAGLITFLAFRYRRGSKVDRSGPVDTDHRLEMIWTVIPLILAVGVFVWAARLYTEAYAPPKDAKEIFIVGRQWMWYAQHANGIRENNELHVPVGQPVKLTMISQDVIHSFFIPAFRIKRDVMPGFYTSTWFTPTKPGRYFLFCAEYCGTQHSEMTGWVTVLSQADFAKWYRTRDNATPEPLVAPTNAFARQDMAVAGKALYEQLACGSCHDPGGMNRGPLLQGIYGSRVQLANGRTVAADRNYLRESILNPDAKLSARYQSIMPSYKDQLNEDQVNQLIEYIRSLGGESPGQEPTREAGQPLGRQPASTMNRTATTPGIQPLPRGNQAESVGSGVAPGASGSGQGPTGAPAAGMEDDARR